MFEVGINDPLRPSQLLLLGLQNVFGMTGMFVFPGILGRAFNLPPVQIAYVYGMTFIVCGIITILQSVAAAAAADRAGTLCRQLRGAAVGRPCVAGRARRRLRVVFRGLDHLVLSYRSDPRPERRRDFRPIPAGAHRLRHGRDADHDSDRQRRLAKLIGQRTGPGFPFVNLLAGAVAVAAIIGVMLWGGRLRRAAILIGLALGTLCYAGFRPLSLAAVAAAPLFVTPHWFPFGFEVQPDLVIVFLLVLIPAGMGSMALYQTVADWGEETLTPGRMSEGIFGVALGSVVAGIFGGFSTIAYPDNIGMLRATRVGSRYATLAAGILLIVLGGCIKFDMLLVLVPLPVISAAATLLFGIVFMHGVHILAQVDWDDRRLIAAGLAFLVGLGGLFIAPDVMQAMPLMLQLLLQQPVISGGLTLVVLHSLLCSTPPAAKP